MQNVATSVSANPVIFHRQWIAIGEHPAHKMQLIHERDPLPEGHAFIACNMGGRIGLLKKSFDQEKFRVAVELPGNE